MKAVLPIAALAALAFVAPLAAQQAPASESNKPAVNGVEVVRAHVDTLLEGISLARELEQRIRGSVIPLGDTLAQGPDQAFRMGVLARVQALVRAQLNDKQQPLFDQNIEAWRRRQSATPFNQP